MSILYVDGRDWTSNHFLIRVTKKKNGKEGFQISWAWMSLVCNFSLVSSNWLIAEMQ